MSQQEEITLPPTGVFNGVIKEVEYNGQTRTRGLFVVRIRIEYDGQSILSFVAGTLSAMSMILSHKSSYINSTVRIKVSHVRAEDCVYPCCDVIWGIIPEEEK